MKVLTLMITAGAIADTASTLVTDDEIISR